MIKCKKFSKCIYSHCCVECDAQKSKGFQCGCNACEDLLGVRENIIKHCEYAVSEDTAI